MSTTPMRRQPSVQVNEHSAFALELAAYVNEARAGMSAREFARRAAAGTHDHWSKILASKKVMTTNDVKVAADVLDMDPYVLVENARRWGEGQRGGNITPIRPDVGGHADDGYQNSPYPESPAAAAETERKPGE